MAVGVTLGVGVADGVAVAVALGVGVAVGPHGVAVIGGVGPELGLEAAFLPPLRYSPGPSHRHYLAVSGRRTGRTDMNSRVIQRVAARLDLVAADWGLPSITTQWRRKCAESPWMCR